MHQFQRAFQAAQLSRTERGSATAGVLLIAAAAVAAADSGDLGGVARLLAAGGLLALVVCAASRGRRAYRAGLPASLPTSVGSVPIRPRTRRPFSVATAGLALGLPVVLAVAAIVLVEWAWPFVAAAVLLHFAATAFGWMEALDDYEYPSLPAPKAAEHLRRLCMIADIPPPELVVEPGPLATAWTTRGRVHVTKRALQLLDDREVEAVLAHEIAHLAHRDAALMDVCSAPSRALLGYARFVMPRLWGWIRACASVGMMGIGVWVVAVALLTVPLGYAVGWLSRLSVLGLSRAREFSADAAAVAITGRPSALASALMKLDHQRDWAATADLRRVDADAVLCIISIDRSALDRLLSSHPATARRVARLAEMETRLQSGRAS